MHGRLFIDYRYAVLKGLLLISYLFNRGLLNPNLLFVFQRVSRSVYKGMLEVLKAAVYGFEVSVENEDIKGIASAFQFLEIAHTHYHGRDIKDEIARLRDDDDMSIVSNSDSTISNLSDHSRDMASVSSWVAETGQ